MAGTAADRIGVVVIGRNEGDRLVRCLESLRGEARRIVYVDSSSSDASVAKARVSGASVLELDPEIPFTAARARNAGFERLIAERPDLELVQFVDGDCEVRSGWLEYAAECLDERRELAVACGRRRERFPARSAYNRIADIEWDTPVGDARSCGGDSLMRVRAFQAVGGFDASLIAGEEPELCLRLRRAGYKVARLPCEMTLHDAAMLHFSQFWRRAVRAGHAYAEAAYRHGREPERFGVRPVVSSAVWGAGPP
ncbi:MAG: glycosyltransferase family 2 protein, partial [Myxococcota bacterium]